MKYFWTFNPPGLILTAHILLSFPIKRAIFHISFSHLISYANTCSSSHECMDLSFQHKVAKEKKKKRRQSRRERNNTHTHTHKKCHNNKTRNDLRDICSARRHSSRSLNPPLNSFQAQEQVIYSSNEKNLNC